MGCGNVLGKVTYVQLTQTTRNFALLVSIALTLWGRTFCDGVVFFGVFLSLGGLAEHLIEGLARLVSEAVQDVEDPAEDDPTKAFLREEATRFKKTLNYVKSASSGDRTICVVIGMRPVVKIMGSFFTSARRFQKVVDHDMLALLLPEKTPITKCLNHFFEMLNDESSASWYALIGGRDWSSKLYHQASVPILYALGNFSSDLSPI